MRAFLSAIAATMLLAALVVSSSSAGPLRKWTDTTGKFSVDAEFVELKSGEVHLRKADGSVITVPANKLSELDRTYLSNRVTSKPAAPSATATTPEEKRANAEAASLTKLADDEGNISRDAWSKFIQAFRDFDADSDDALDLEELKVAGREELLLKLADTNTDGKIVRGEWAPLSRSFARLDKNKNALLEVAEMQAAAEVTLAKSSGTASLAAPNDPAQPANNGPTLWRGRIEGRGRIELVIAGNQIVGREIDGNGQGVGGLGTGNYSMTGDGKLGNMDAVYLDGPQRGQVCYGIYQLNGDTLTWCCNNRGQRPTAFNGGNGNWLMTLTRVPQP